MPHYFATSSPAASDSLLGFSNFLQRRYGPDTIIHFEDFGASNAFMLLRRLQQAGAAVFNDDIQCTAAITVAAVLAGLRLRGVLPLSEQVFMFFGAGQANLGVSELLVKAAVEEGLGEAQVRHCHMSCWLQHGLTKTFCMTPKQIGDSYCDRLNTTRTCLNCFKTDTGFNTTGQALYSQCYMALQ